MTWRVRWTRVDTPRCLDQCCRRWNLSREMLLSLFLLNFQCESRTKNALWEQSDGTSAKTSGDWRTAGRAKNEMANMAKKEAMILPTLKTSIPHRSRHLFSFGVYHVTGYTSPYLIRHKKEKRKHSSHWSERRTEWMLMTNPIVVMVITPHLKKKCTGANKILVY